MPFKYTASTGDGEVRHGESMLNSRESVIGQLESDGLIVIAVEEIAENDGGGRGIGSISIGGVSHVEKLLFTKHLSVMLKAGLTLSDALNALVDQTKSPKFKRILTSVRRSVERGESFSNALEKQDGIFSPFYVHVVRAGELSGTLEENLQHLAEQFVKDYNLIKRVKSALMYPTIVFGAALLIGFFFATYVLPQVNSIFSGLDNIDLPWMTKVLLAVSGFMRAHTLLSFLVMIGTAVFGWWFLHRNFIKPVTHYLTLHIPIIGPIVKQVNLARFTLILGTLLKSGIDIVRALEITREVIDNIYYKRVIAVAHLDMQRGITLRESLRSYDNLFPPIVTHMIDVGEQSGELEEVLQYLSEFYELEVESTMKNLASILEPVLLLFIGLVAMGLAYAILIPIYNYISAIRGI